MPRMTNETSALVADLHRRIDAIVAAARDSGRSEALAQIQHLVGGGAAPVRRGPGRPPKSASAAAAPAKPRAKRKNSWAGLSAEARLARINAIRKGKGLAPREK
jgi:hypothetical protein